VDDQDDFTQESHDFNRIRHRVRQKAESYKKYEFDDHYNDFLKTFFDLAQEFDSLDDFYRICVAVPLEITGFESALYLFNQSEDRLELVCDCVHGVLLKPQIASDPIRLCNYEYCTDDSYLIPIFSKSSLVDDEKEGEIKKIGTNKYGPYLSSSIKHFVGSSQILGMFEVRPLEDMSDTDKFFFRKYSNRIGYNMHNRLIALQNIDHIKFIKNLVKDIEHNVIVPNMYFKHLFNQLRKSINKLGDIKQELSSSPSSGKKEVNTNIWTDKLAILYEELVDQYQQLIKHHANISMFLESLFRREHFERGKLVLRLRTCSIENDVILPQLEYYSRRFRSADISVERSENILQEESQLQVDIGLLSQVFANLFSNAAKYTKEICDHEGKTRKVMAYGRELVESFGEYGKKGVKFNVFTTGPHLSVAQGYRYLEDGIRGEDSNGVPGTGHGLAFIRYVIEMHGGVVGYEPTQQGNNFFFILPMSSTNISPDLVDSNN